MWHKPTSNVALEPGDVHVWRASLQSPVETVERLQRVLSAEEAARANRFYFAKDRTHFIVARGVLRTLLGRYLHMEPAQLRFIYNSYGKPALDLPGECTLQFNISHSHELALFAFTDARRIGIDVEYMRASVEYLQLAKHFFSPEEDAVLQTLSPAMLREGFFNCWTRKEAYIKARGEGLSIPLDMFEVSLRPDEPAALLRSREDPQEVERWSLVALAPGNGYIGALAVEGRVWHLNCFAMS